MKALIRLLILLFIFTIGVISFALTPTGLQVAMKIVKPFIPGKLHYHKLSGVVIGPITVDDLQYQNADETIHVKSLTFNWQPLKLLKREFQISSLAASGVMIKIHDPLFSQKLDEKTAKEWIALAIHAFKHSDSFFHIAISDAHFKAITVKDNRNQTRGFIQQLLLRTIMTPQQWDTAFDVIFLQPHPFNLQFHLLGKPTNYHFHLSINGYQTAWSMKGTGYASNIHFATEKTVFLNGTLAAKWDITFEKQLAWNGFLKANQVNSALIDPQWITPISINIISSGEQGKTIQTNTQATIQIPTATLQLTASRKNNWHVQWNLAVSSLSRWVHNAEGALHSQGTIEGDLDNPTMNIHVTGNYSNASLKLQQLNLLLTGNLKRHTLSAHITMPKNTIDLALSGQLHKQQWQGQLQQFTVGLGGNNAWRLKTTAQLDASRSGFGFTNICLQHTGIGDACIAARDLHNQLTAQTTLQFVNLSWLMHFFPTIKIPEGGLNANLQLSGTLQKPQVTGDIHLNNARLQIPSINITLHDIAATINGENHLIHFDLTAFSQQQPIKAEGTVDLTDPNLAVKMHVTSDNALLLNTEQYMAYATADLDMVLIGKNLSITGDLTLPKGLIAPNDFQNTQTIPREDIVYVGAIQPKSNSGWIISANINTHIGKDVDLNVAGFTSKIEGDLLLTKKDTESFFASGEIFMHHAMYHVYGQTLTVEPHSYITYTHSLLSDPGLSIRASKSIQSVDNFGGVSGGFSQKTLTVGISITGTAKTPHIAFFSSRGNLSQADILSYILLGYASTSTTPGNTDFLLRALSAVNLTSQGLLGKQNLATQIQQGLGLREMGVESETTIDALGNPLNRQSAFVFGKSFSRHFYARYSIGLLDSVNVFQLRYLFNKHWAVQSDSSSLGNGADVLYTVDFD